MTHSPLMQALLACDIVGIELDVGEQAVSAVPHEDFVLNSVLSDEVTISIVHEIQDGTFRVQSMARLTETDLPQGAVLALSLNHVARAEDRFSLDPETQSLVFTRTLAVDGLDLSELAFAVRCAVEVAVSLVNGELPEILLEDSPPAAPPPVEPMIRG